MMELLPSDEDCADLPKGVSISSQLNKCHGFRIEYPDYSILITIHESSPNSLIWIAVNYSCVGNNGYAHAWDNNQLFVYRESKAVGLYRMLNKLSNNLVNSYDLAVKFGLIKMANHFS